MSFVKPKYSKGQVNRAGTILAAPEQFKPGDLVWAYTVLTNWRACHGYPINTFQSTLRHRLKAIDAGAIVAQRLKRAPSIVIKLRRFEGMNLSRMQDIGGLRAVVASVSKARKLDELYRTASFQHQLVGTKNYINTPKEDGYRSIHLIYRYVNENARDYNGLSLELQIRSRIQHAWATAVETMGTFLGQALKSGQGDTEWRTFFTTASAALALIEKTPPVPGFEGRAAREVYKELADAERNLKVLEKLKGFAIATDQITTERGQGGYHLIILDSAKKTVSIRPYPIAKLEQANLDYAEIEKRTQAGEAVEAVLVSAGPVGDLRKAYPNYFLDTNFFVEQIQSIITTVP